MAAAKKKLREMVLLQEGVTSPAAADHSPGGVFEQRMEQGSHVDCAATEKPSKIFENLPPERVCKGIRVTLDNNNMWNEFFRCRTEMILTKQGSRMFPYCRFRISGLNPSKKYCLIMDIQPVDANRYRWTGRGWQVSGKAESFIRSPPFTHPDSPSSGQHWMKSPISFYKLKLTNDVSEKDGNTILHPMHRYIPRLYVIQTEKAAKDVKLNSPGVIVFSFPQTEFLAVTAYQNTQFTQLKVDYNPFAKGLKDDSSGSKGLNFLKLNSSKEPAPTVEQNPVKRSLKSLLANHKPRSSKPANPKPPTPSEAQKNSTKDQPAAKVPPEPSCNPRPTQKLFSERIREAHVALQRCNLAQFETTSQRTSQSNTKSSTNSVPEKETKKSQMVKTYAKHSEPTKGQANSSKDSVVFIKDNARPDVLKENKHSPMSSCFKPERTYESSSDAKINKRLAPLPLPALALFLKQHTAKSKKAKLETETSKEPKGESQAKKDCLEPHNQEGKLWPSISEREESQLDTQPQVPKQELRTRKAPLKSCQPVDKLQSSSSKLNKLEHSADHSYETGCPLTNSESVAQQSKQELHQVLQSKSSPLEVHESESIPASKLDSTQAPSEAPTQELHTAVQKPASRSRKTKSRKLKWCKLNSHRKHVPVTSPHRDSTVSLPEAVSAVSLLSGSDKTEPSKDLSADISKLSHDLDSEFLEKESVGQPLCQESPKPLQTDDSLCPVTDNSVLSVLPSSSPPFCAFQTISSPPFTTSTSRLDSVLPISNPTQTEPTDSPLLPDPECSEFGFEPLSPASSSEPLPALPESLALDLEPSDTPKVDSQHEKNMSKPESSVFKWHTVLLPQEQCLSSPFTSFQPSHQTLPPITDSALPSQTLPSALTSEPPSFQESEQSLPFPGELSPLALQLPLSPTFSLDGDALSPTPSLTDLVQFFSTADEDLGIGEVFTNTVTEEGTAQAPVPHSGTTVEPQPQEQSHHTRPIQPSRNQKKSKKKKACRQPKVDLYLEQDDPSYAVMKPSLEEVEEQLFISFTSKEALELHIGDSPESSLPEAANTDATHNGGRKTPVSEQSQPQDMTLVEQRPVTQADKPLSSPQTGGNKEITAAKVYKEPTAKSTSRKSDTNPGSESLDEKILELEETLLRNLKRMKHRQVIHPLLQEVGLKMTMLDPTQPVDLQYLGIPLPLPPPGATQELNHTENSVSSVFVSRTGKTSDMTQIKGWRDKFTSETALPPEGGPIPEPPKKNLSAFCSDMLDEYLETEGKLIDERASTFTNPEPAPVPYDVPTHSSSYIKTLHHVLNTTTHSTTANLISTFVPPSKRPKPPAPSKSNARKTLKQKGLKKNLGNTPLKIPDALNSESQHHLDTEIKNKELSGTKKLKKKQRLLKSIFGFESDQMPTIKLRKDFLKLDTKELFAETEKIHKMLEQDNASRDFHFNSNFLELDEFDFMEPLSEAPKKKKLKNKNKFLEAKHNYLVENHSEFDYDVKDPVLDTNHAEYDKNQSSKYGNNFETSKSTIQFEFDHTEPISEAPELIKNSSSPKKKRRRRRFDSLGMDHMAPLESDSELGTQEKEEKPTIQNEPRESSNNQSRPLVTKALLKQRELEQSAVSEGNLRTHINEERATVALSSLFTIKGFVAEDPHVPVKLRPRPPLQCLNDFCRLGCMCSSLTHTYRTSHCRRAQCMFRCSCLKQKVVLLRNLDTSDSSPTSRLGAKKKKKRRMKMAYVLKEVDRVSHPAEPIRTLWVRTNSESDPEPVQAPKLAPVLRPITQKEFSEEGATCARIRSFSGRRLKQKKMKTCKPESAGTAYKDSPANLAPCKTSPSPALSSPSEFSGDSQSCARIRGFKHKQKSPQSNDKEKPAAATDEASQKKLSKRLVLLANCKWRSEGDRVAVMKVLCEALTLGSLERPFWIGPHLVSPLSQSVEIREGKPCVEVRVHISTPEKRKETPKKKSEEETKEKSEEETKEKSEEEMKEKSEEETTKEKSEEETTKEEETKKRAKEQVKQGRDQSGSDTDEEEMMDWQKQVEDGDSESGDEMVDDSELFREQEPGGGILAVPFLRGISASGILSAGLRTPGQDSPIQVNGKLYPLAKVQLGRMGALHPANRLAAYLTGRAGGANRLMTSASPVTSASNMVATSSSARVGASTSASTGSTVSPGSAQSKVSPGPGSAQSKVNPGGSGPGVSMKEQSKSQAPGLKATVQPSTNPPHVLMIQVPGPIPAPAGPLTPLTLKQIPPKPQALRLPAPSNPSRLALQLVASQSMSPGARLFRKPDGKLVQLIPVQPSPIRFSTPVINNDSNTNKNMLIYRAVNKGQTTLVPVSTQSSASSVFLGSSPSGVSLNPAPSGLSGFQSFRVSPRSTFVSPKSGFSFKIIPGKSTTETVVVKIPEVLSKAAPVSTQAVPLASRPVEDTQTSTKNPEIIQKNVTPTASDQRSVEKVTGVEEKEELAVDLNDLDVICVDEDDVLEMRSGSGQVQVKPDGGVKGGHVVMVDSSSEETDNSSDYSSSDEIPTRTNPRPEEQPEDTTHEKVKQRIHNHMERERRKQMQNLFQSLRKTVGLGQEGASKISVLTQAQSLIRKLRATEKQLRTVKFRLKLKREELLDKLVPKTDKASGQKPKDSVVTQEDDHIIEVIDLLSDEESASHKQKRGDATNQLEEQRNTEKLKGQLKDITEDMLQGLIVVSAEEEHAYNCLSSVLGVSDKLKIQLLQKACAELSSLQTKGLRLQKEKLRLKREQERLHKHISEELEYSDPSNKNRLTTPLKTVTSSPVKAPPPTILPSSPIKATPPKTVAKAPPPKIVTSSPVKALPTQAVTLSPVKAYITQNSTVRQRTVPNILSRRRTSSEGPASVQTVVPTSFMMSSAALPQQLLPGQVFPAHTLSGSTLPGQLLQGGQVLTLSPVLQTSSVALNLPTLTNQQLSSGPYHSAGGNLNLVRLVPSQTTTVQPPQKLQLPSTPDTEPQLSSAPAPPGLLLPSAPAPPGLLLPSAPASPGLQLPSAPAPPGLLLPSASATPGLQLPSPPASPELPSAPASPGLQLPSASATPGLQLPSAPAQEVQLPSAPAPPGLQLPSAPAPPELQLPPAPRPETVQLGPAVSNSNVDQSEASPETLASLLDEINFLNQNSLKSHLTDEKSTNQSQSPALVPPPLVKVGGASVELSNSEAASKVLPSIKRTGKWKPMPRLQRRSRPTS